MNHLQRFLQKGIAYVLHYLKVRLFRNSLILMGNDVLQAVLGLAYWVLAARLYSPTDVGLLAGLVAATGMLTGLSTLGLEMGLLRFLPGTSSKARLINQCLTLPALSSIGLATVFILGLSLWSPKLLFLRHDALFFITFIIVSSFTVQGFVQHHALIGLLRPELAMLRSSLWSVLRLPLLVALASYGIWGLWLSWGLAVLVVGVSGFIILWRVVPGYSPRPILGGQGSSSIMRFSLPTYVSESLAAIPQYVLPLMVLQLLGPEANAYYYVAYRIGNMAAAPSRPVAMSLLVEGSHRIESLKINFIRAISLNFGLLVPVVAIFLLFGEKLLLVFGGKYLGEALTVFQLIVLATLPAALIDIFIQIQRVRLTIKSTIFIWGSSAILCSGSAYVLMRVAGLTGAGLGLFLGLGIVSLAVAALMVRMAVKYRKPKLEKEVEPGI